jgi:fructokinase
MHDGRVSHAAGGTAANVAADLAFLGWNASLAGRFGNDAPGRRIKRDLQMSGVDLTWAERGETVSTPVVLHTIDPPRHAFGFRCPRCDRRLPKHRPITDGRRREIQLSLDAAPPRVFFFDRSSAPAIRLARALKPKRTLIMFEPSSAGLPERTATAAALSGVLKWSHERRGQLPRAMFAARKGQIQIETLGEAGLRYRQGRRPWRSMPAVETAAVDSAGAGDWLTAGLLHYMISGSSGTLSEALERAQGIAALSCRFPGARTLASVDRASVTRASTHLRQGHRVALAAAPPPSSRARGVCALCLGPV